MATSSVLIVLNAIRPTEFRRLHVKAVLLGLETFFPIVGFSNSRVLINLLPTGGL